MKIRGLFIGVILALIVVYAVYFSKTGGKSNLKVMVDKYAEAKIDLTKVNLATLERIIEERTAVEGQAPADLKELQRSQPMPISAVDAWGREIRYEKLSDSSFRLTSAGPDRKYGTGDDIVKEY
jgi:hypothetical protein